MDLFAPTAVYLALLALTGASVVVFAYLTTRRALRIDWPVAWGIAGCLCGLAVYRFAGVIGPAYR